MRCAQCVFSGCRPSVRQSSSTAWSNDAGAHGPIEGVDGRLQLLGRQIQLRRKLPDRARRLRRKHRRHESADRLGIDDRKRDLVGLPGHERSPDGVALRPEVLALVVEALGVLVDDDAEREAIEPRDDAAVELRRARIDGDRVALARDRRPAARRRRASASGACPVLYGVPRMMKLSAASPQISRSQSRFDSNPPVAITAALARIVRSRPPVRTRRGAELPVEQIEADDLGVVQRPESRDARPRRSSCSSAPCRRRGRTRWCGPDAACRAGATESGRRIAASTQGSPPTRERPDAPALRRSRLR